ncbi:barstar family protein [Comamonas guangdongensis]|uniref:Barstar family protein n=1 Tax=Comamonas guangdongensis TaxID=510515 RepID=A0ABV4A2Y1_9BURK
MREYTIECRGLKSEAEFWAAYLAEVKPDGAHYFGRNLNAFWDAVSVGGPGSPGDNCALRFVHTDSLSTWRNGEFVSALRRIAAESKWVVICID